MNRFQWKTIRRAKREENKYILDEWQHNFIADLFEKGQQYDLSPAQNSMLNKIGSQCR